MDETPGPEAPQGRKRPTPPVIELQANDISPDRPSAQRETREQREETANKRGGFFAGPLPAILSAVIGLLVGSLALALVFLFVRGGSMAAITGQGTDPNVAALEARVDQLLKLAAESEKRLAAVEARPAPQAIDLAPLNARIEGLENSLIDLRKLGEQAQSASAAAIEALNNRLGALETRLTQPTRPPVANAAQIVALGALRDAINSGGPYAKEFAAVRAMLGENAAALATLEASANEGLPTTARLSARFNEIAPKLARDAAPADGYFARLMANLSNLVEVRPVGEVEGASQGAIVARMEERLKRGDLSAALDEGAKLPVAARTIGADWFALASRRRDAELAVKNLINAELAALAAEPK